MDYGDVTHQPLIKDSKKGEPLEAAEQSRHLKAGWHSEAQTQAKEFLRDGAFEEHRMPSRQEMDECGEGMEKLGVKNAHGSIPKILIPAAIVRGSFYIFTLLFFFLFAQVWFSNTCATSK